MLVQFFANASFVFFYYNFSPYFHTISMTLLINIILCLQSIHLGDRWYFVKILAKCLGLMRLVLFIVTALIILFYI